MHTFLWSCSHALNLAGSDAITGARNSQDFHVAV